MPRHITNYHERVKNGLWSYGPEHLEEMIKSGIINCENGVLSYANPDEARRQCIFYISYNSSIDKRRVLDQPYKDGQVASEYFYENTGDTLACTLLDTYVDFGSCSRYRMVDSHAIRISNNTTGKMSCVWVMPGEGTECVFM